MSHKVKIKHVATGNTLAASPIYDTKEEAQSSADGCLEELNAIFGEGTHSAEIVDGNEADGSEEQEFAKFLEDIRGQFENDQQEETLSKSWEPDPSDDEDELPGGLEGINEDVPLTDEVPEEELCEEEA